MVAPDTAFVDRTATSRNRSSMPSAAIRLRSIVRAGRLRSHLSSWRSDDRSRRTTTTVCASNRVVLQRGATLLPRSTDVHRPMASQPYGAGFPRPFRARARVCADSVPMSRRHGAWFNCTGRRRPRSILTGALGNSFPLSPALPCTADLRHWACSLTPLASHVVGIGPQTRVLRAGDHAMSRLILAGGTNVTADPSRNRCLSRDIHLDC